MPISKDWLRRLNEAAEKARIMEEGQMKAPTQEQLNDPEWWDENAGTASHYCRGKGQFYDYRLHHAPCCSARPTKPAAPEWNGGGLPPVGCEVEYSFGMFQCPDAPVKRAKYIGPDHDNLVIKFLGEHEGSRFTSTSPSCVRPLCAQEYRDRKDLTETIKGAVRLGLNERGIANMVWASGWRKGDS